MSITRPSGIIPITDETVAVTALETLVAYVILVLNINIPRGKMIIVAIRIIQLMERISSDFDFLNFFASLISLEA